MLRTMVDYNVMFYVMGVVAAIGVCSKLVSQFALKRLVRASGNMNKSTHKLMKLMRAKYEHACMISDKVQNVGAFVDKYVFEYRILGFRLHTWQQSKADNVDEFIARCARCVDALFCVWYGRSDLSICRKRCSADGALVSFTYHN